MNLPSLKYFMLISQDEALVEVYHRSDDGVMYKVYDLLESEIPLTDAGISLKMADIYEEITFPAPEVAAESNEVGQATESA